MKSKINKPWYRFFLIMLGVGVVFGCANQKPKQPAVGNRMQYPTVANNSAVINPSLDFQKWLSRVQSGSPITQNELDQWLTKARMGQVEAQRAVALLLLSAQHPQFANGIQACAWMFVITRKDPKNVDKVDAKFLELACNQLLDGVQRGQALTMGRKWFKEIYRREPAF